MALRKVYRPAYRRIQADLAAIVRRIEAAEAAGEPVAVTWRYTHTRLVDLAEQMDRELGKLSDRGAAVTETAQQEAAGFAEARTGRLIEAAGIDVSWNRLPAETLRAFAGLAGDGSPLADLFREMAGDGAHQVRDAIGAGLAAGDNPRTVARQVAGITGKSRARAETICRTEMLRASREATRASYQANRDVVSGYVRLSARNARVCPACWALDGKRYDTDQPMHQHPNCRCVMLPEFEGAEYDTGEDALSALSEGEQQAALGPDRWQAWRDGTPLSSFAEEYDDPRWGPSVRVKGL